MKETHQKLIGQSFGNLIIRDIIPFYVGKYRNYNATVYCSVCKKTGTMRLRSILSGKAKSCGCQKYKNKPTGLHNKKCIDIRGEKFGMLSPLRIDSRRTDRIYWECLCDCGVCKSVAAKHLRNGTVTSCGCQQYKLGKNNPTWKGYEKISGKYWETLRRNAFKRKLDFQISIEYAWQIFQNQNEKCALTGLPLTFKTKSDSCDGTASLDRIDSSNGYVEGNIQWVDKNVNTVKWDLSIDNFFRVCKMVVEHNKL